MIEKTNQSIHFHIINHNLFFEFENIYKNMKKVEGGGFETQDIEAAKKAESEGAIEIDTVDTQPGGKIEKIIIVEGALESDEVTYLIEVDDVNQRGEISLSEKEILSYRRFREKYLATFQTLLPNLKNAEWEGVIAPLIKEADRTRDETDEAPIIIETINRIESSEVVLDKKDLIGGSGYKVWLEESTNTLFLVSSMLEPIVEKHKISLRRLSSLLRDYRVGASRRERIRNKLFHLWQLNPEKFTLRRGDKNHDTKDMEQTVS